MYKLPVTLTLTSVLVLVFNSNALVKINDSNKLRFRIVLNIDDSKMMYMKQLHENISNPLNEMYKKYLKPNEIQELLVNNTENIKVLDWVNNNNLTCDNYKYVFSCFDYIYKLNKLFNVTMYYHYYNNKTYIKSLEDFYTIPTEISEYIAFVDGISNNIFNPRKTKYSETLTQTRTKASSPVPDTRLVGRDTLQYVYNISTNDTIRYGSSGCVIEFRNGGYQNGLLEYYEMINNIYSDVISINHSIGNNDQFDIETLLDMDMLLLTSGNLTLWYANFDTWIYEMTTYFGNAEQIPYVVSISYGWSIRDQCMFGKCNNITSGQYVEYTDIGLMIMGMRGITIVVASGDAGSPSRSNEGCDDKEFHINAEYPGSSPYVLSVGGVFLDKSNQKFDNPETLLCTLYDCAKGREQSTINYDDVEWTTGGGFGMYTTQSNVSWQHNLVEEYLNSGVYLPPEHSSTGKVEWNRKMRAYPDVVALAHNCPIYGGMLMLVDGTSCSAPIVAGMMVLINDYMFSVGRQPIGFINNILYQSVERSNDNIISNHNITITNTHCTEYQCCNELFGFEQNDKQSLWNPISGLGSINYGNLLRYLSNEFD